MRGLPDITNKMQGYAKEAVQLASYRALIYLKKYMDVGKNTSGAAETFAPSQSKQIGKWTGKLTQSLIPGKPGNINSVKTDGNNVVWEFGSNLPYANIHEYGRFVKSKGKMQKYFWAKFNETHNPYMKNLALAVMKKGGVNIPARPYFRKGFKDFTDSKEGFNKIMTDIIEKITSEFEHGSDN